jgi:hypothetical protein
MMRLRSLLLLATSSLFVGCGSSPVAPGPDRATAVVVAGIAPVIGASTQFSATAALGDGSSRSVTAEATWESSYTAIATVAQGMVTGIAAGEVDITARYQNATGRQRITVRATAVVVTGIAPVIGASAQFSATASLGDGSSRSVTAEATWESSDTAIATVAQGIVTGIAAGEVDITARYQNVTGTLHITVSTTPCTYSVGPSTVSFSAVGGTASVGVFTSASCSWTTANSSSFVTITNGASGTGSGTTSLSVPANTGDARSAILMIAGRLVTVSQSAGNCVTAVSPSNVDYSAELKRGTVSVTAAPGCPWTATTTSSFIGLSTFGVSGTGSGSFSYRVFGNLTGGARAGSLKVMQHTVNVTQRAPLGGNFLSFVSDPGDYIGQGWTLFHEAPTSTFTATTPSPSRISMSIIGSDGLSTLNWSLEFAAPQGQPLVAGTYLNATRYPFQAPTVPGLSFYGDGRGCNTLSGQFTIASVSYGSDGSLQFLQASFEQHCEGGGPALRGTVFYTR